MSDNNCEIRINQHKKVENMSVAVASQNENVKTDNVKDLKEIDNNPGALGEVQRETAMPEVSRSWSVVEIKNKIMSESVARSNENVTAPRLEMSPSMAENKCEIIENQSVEQEGNLSEAETSSTASADRGGLIVLTRTGLSMLTVNYNNTIA